jgi:GntR family transcriptional regulator
MAFSDFSRTRAIDKSIPIPLYYQLKELLYLYIEQATNGDPIPTEKELCEIFDISRPTVRQAIIELVNEGCIFRKKGKGSFVLKPKIDQDFLLVVESFNDEMQSKGLTPITKVLDARIRKANLNVAENLGLKEDDEVVFLSRLRSIQGEAPLVLVNTFLPGRQLAAILEKDLVNESMYKIFERDFDLSIRYTKRVLEARLAGRYEAEKLKISEHAPIQYIETVAYLFDGNAIEYSQASYRGDRNKFTVEIRRQQI